MDERWRVERWPLSARAAANSLSCSHPLPQKHTRTQSYTHTLCPQEEKPKRQLSRSDGGGGETHILALSPSLCVFLSPFLAHILHLYLSLDAVASHTLHKWKQSSNKLQYEDLSINRDQYQLISGCLSFCVWMCLSQFKGQEIISSLKKRWKKIETRFWFRDVQNDSFCYC